MPVKVNNDTAICTGTREVTDTNPSLSLYSCLCCSTVMPSFQPFQHFTITNFLILSEVVERGGKMNCDGENFLLMSPIFPFVFPFMTCLIHYHNSSRLPQQTTMTCFSVFQGGTRTERLGLLKLDENLVALLAEGSSHSCHIVQQQVNC